MSENIPLLKKQNPDVKDNIRYFQPFILDDVSVKLGSWSGYNLLAQHQSKKKFFRNLTHISRVIW